MYQFQRSQSKVWWGSYQDEEPFAPQDVAGALPASHASYSRQGSPLSHKSHDSGFSDSDTSPQIKDNQEKKNQLTQSLGSSRNSEMLSTENSIPKNIATPNKNFADSYTEKYSPKKSVSCHLNEQKRNDQKSPADAAERYRLDYIDVSQVKVSSTTTSRSVMNNSLEHSFSSLTTMSPVKATDRSMRSPDQSYGSMSPKSLSRSPSKESYSPDQSYGSMSPDSASASPKHLNLSQDQSYGSLSPDNSSRLSPTLLEKIYKLEYSTTSPMVGAFEKCSPFLSGTPRRVIIQEDSTQPIENQYSSEIPSTPKRKGSPKPNKNLMSCFPSRSGSKENLADKSNTSLDYSFNDSKPSIDEATAILKTPKSILKFARTYNNETYELEIPSHFERIHEFSNSSQQKMISSSELSNSSQMQQLIPYPELNPSCTSTPKMYYPHQLPESPTAVRQKQSSLRRVNLLHNFNRSVGKSNGAVPKTRVAALPKGLIRVPAPVQCWLADIHSLVEPEAMTMLQNKALSADLNRKIAVTTSNASNVVRRIRGDAAIILNEFWNIEQKLKENADKNLPPLIQSLVGNISEFVLKRSKENNCVGDKMEQSSKTTPILKMCDSLKLAAAIELKQEERIIENIAKLKNLFDEFTQDISCQHLQVILTMIEEPSSDMMLRAVISSLSSMISVWGKEITKLLTTVGIPRALLYICVDVKRSSIRASALRVLTMLCQDRESITQFMESGGMDVISDIISDNKRSEPEVREAVTVLTQITLHWDEVKDQVACTELQTCIPIYVKSISHLIGTTECCQTLLICAAALANLSQLDSTNINIGIWSNAITNLISTVKSRGPKVSIFLQEQTSTVLANIANVADCRKVIESAGGVPSLFYFLDVGRRRYIKDSEQAAARRLLENTTIALSRLCAEREIAREIVSLEGVSSLMSLCRDNHQNNSIIIACLSSLRKIASHCDGIMSTADAEELLKPKLMDSLLSLNAKQESYV